MPHQDHQGNFITGTDSGLDTDNPLSIPRFATNVALNELEKYYLQIREKEGRIYADELVRRLPLIEKTDAYFKEWELRLIATLRLHKYLMDKGQSLKILDIGCGNGWFANLMTQIYDSRVFAIDINQTELDQADRLFGDNPDLHIDRHDITRQAFPEKEFDVIVLAATVQYFPNIEEVIADLLSYLSDKGEIHVIDSPLYKESERKQAQRRSERYYTEMGVPEMAKFYHHHAFTDLDRFDYELKYDPNSFLNKIRRKVLSTSDSPFPWIIIHKVSQDG